MFLNLKFKASQERWVLLALFIIGLLIRAHLLGAYSLGDDELTTVVRIKHSFLETVWILRHSSFPPLHYAFLNLWVGVFGQAEGALRAPCAIFSALTILVIYKLGKEIFNKEAGLIAAALLAFSPFALHHAQFAKMYALFWFLSGLSFLYFFRFLENRRENAYLFYIISSILCCYTLYTGFLLLVAQSVIFVTWGQRARLKEWWGAQAVILACFIPWVLCFLCSRHDLWGLIRPGVAFDYVKYFLGSFLLIIGSGLHIWTSKSWAQYSSEMLLWEINGFVYVFLLVSLLADLGITSLKGKNTGEGLAAKYYGLLLWILLPCVIYFIFDHIFVHINLEARYIGFIQIPVFLLVSSQVSKLPGFAKSAVLALILALAMTNVYWYFRDSLAFPQQDWRSTASELSQEIRPGDIVLTYINTAEFKYYYKADMSHFYMIPETDLPSEYLVRKGILKPQVRSVFIIYKNGPAPDIKLDGFVLEQRIYNGGNGYLHFTRALL